MKRILLLLSAAIFFYALWNTGQKHFENNSFDSAIEAIKSEIDIVSKDPELSQLIERISLGFQLLVTQIQSTLEELPETKTNEQSTPIIDKPQLETPTNQDFSIHNIQIGDTKEQVEKQIGASKRSSYNEYGIEWFTYHENYQNFVMVSYDKNNTVAGMYTNQDLISSTKNISYGSSKQQVLEALGEPLKSINKGRMIYQFEENRDYEVYLVNDTYTTIFYDKHRQNIVTAIQLISKDLENAKKSFYTEETDQLKEGFEYQLFDLTNAARVVHGLSLLEWDDAVRVTARKHSADMAQNNYFSHTNLAGQSPFDRMLEDEIVFTVAGENLAYGQFSSIFAHEGLMNSMGHRENILQKDYEYLGVGVAFNQESQPYYTQNYFSP
ncbi:serine protease [Bacillus sp. BGMRC 2118]|nr:serine protease [Bacillus sp. BGMRC 2118]